MIGHTQNHTPSKIKDWVLSERWIICGRGFVKQAGWIEISK